MATFVYDAAAAKFIAGTLIWSSTPVNAALVDANYLANTGHTFLSSIPPSAIVRRDLALTGLGETLDEIKYGKLPRLLALTWPYPIVGLVLYNKTGVDATSDLIYYSSDGVGMPFAPQALNWELQFNQVRRGFFRVRATAGPTAPVLAGNFSGSDFVLTWTASASGPGDTVARYDVYRRIDGGSYSLLTTVLSSDPRTYTDAALPGGHTYDYYVIAVATFGGSSVNSNVVSAAPAVPTYLIFASTSASAKSTDGLALVSGGVPGTATTLRGIAFAPTIGVNGRWLISASGGGTTATIYSDNRGVSWTIENPGLGQNMEQVVFAFGKYWMGSNNGSCFYSATGLNGSWTAAMTGSRAYGLWYSPGEARVACAGDANSGLDVPRIFYTDGSVTMSSGSVTGLPTGGGDPGNTLYAIARDDSRGTWFCINGNGKVYSTSDVVAGTWAHLGDLGSTLTGARFAFKPGGPGQPIVIATDSKVFASTNNGASWTDVTPVTSTGGLVIYSTFFGKFFLTGTDSYSSLAGSVWTSIDGAAYLVVGES